MPQLTYICPNCQKPFQRNPSRVKIEAPFCSKKCCGLRNGSRNASTGKRHFPDFADSFWAKVNMGRPDECWNWKGYVHPSGYGRIVIQHKFKLAHRIAYSLKYGEIPDGLHVCHKCDNRLCCNYNHHFLGTNADNQADRDAKGRQTKGEKIGASKLVTSQVYEIRKLYATGKYSRNDLAAQFQVTRVNIGLIVTGRAWKHLLTT
jgi:hypothetical protein